MIRGTGDPGASSGIIDDNLVDAPEIDDAYATIEAELVTDNPGHD